MMGGMFLCASQPSIALTNSQKTIVQSAAQQASQLCLKEMHHDTDEFVDCVNNLIETHKIFDEKQLGYAYLGLVGCLSAMRISTLHSDICTSHYLAVTDKLMKKYKVKDEELCSSVPGNCSVRVAQIKSLRRKKI